VRAILRTRVYALVHHKRACSHILAPSKPEEPCRGITFRGEVKRGDSFQREVGNGLVSELKWVASQGALGWLGYDLQTAEANGELRLGLCTCSWVQRFQGRPLCPTAE